jgi:hypothetical protein
MSYRPPNNPRSHVRPNRGLQLIVVKFFSKKGLQLESISIPYNFLNNYGLKKEHDQKLGFNKKNFIIKVKNLINS